MIADDPRHVRQARRPGQQCRHPARGAACRSSRSAKWDAILAINLSSAFHTTRLALPSMIANKWGRIINIASAHGLVGSAFKSAYVAAKHGMLGLTKVTALETAEQGITCNAICPGYVYTPLVEAQIEGQAKAHGIPREQVIRDVLLAQQPNKRFATTDELGGIAVFLCLGRRRLDHRQPRSRSMAAGPRIEPERQRAGRKTMSKTKTLTPLRSGQRDSQQQQRPSRARAARRRRARRLSGRRLSGAARGRRRARLDHRHLDRRHQCRHHRRQSSRRTALPSFRSSGGAWSARPSGAPSPPGPASPMRCRHG